MINAKEELLNVLGNLLPHCAEIKFVFDDIDTPEKIIRLRRGYSDAQYEAFLSELDFTYDDGYGHQYLFGTVWLDNDTWLERYEYDGSEHWVSQRSPTIPDYL
jgi:hypothetical protein